jgi:DNA-binding transcriptional LysR family regulator
MMGGDAVESLELRIFREVAYAESISKAAEKLGYVQSNVTAHIHRLEEELGTPLFIRHPKGVSLTEAGQQLLPYADNIIGMLENAKKQLQKTDGALKIGATQTIAAYRLPVWLALLKQEFPRLNLAVSTNSQADLIEAVAGGALDCAFVNTEFNHLKLRAAWLFREPLALVTAPGVALEQAIARQPLIVTNIAGCPYRNLLQNWILRQTSQQPEVIEFDTLEAILKAVSLGMGLTLLPVSVLSQEPALGIHPADTIGATHIQLVIPKDAASPHLNRFIEIVRANPG